MVALWEAAMAQAQADMVRLAAALDTAAREVPALTRGVVHRMGEQTVSGAKAIVPVRTGALRNSISVAYGTDDGWWFQAGPTLEYGPYIEWGTSRMAPQPYMGPAFEQAVFEGLATLEELIGRAL